MRAEVVAVGTELLLGQVVDSNSAWIGQQLADAGIDSLFQVKVGDNRGRIVDAIGAALRRSDAVICCGGLGPTQDDITRDAIADVLGVPLVRDESLAASIAELFSARGWEMAANNLRQADVPEGAAPIAQRRGTAPGLICPFGSQVIYAVPGVPHEMREMVQRAVIPDLEARQGRRTVIASRTLRTWGISESTLAERLAPRLAALDDDGTVTVAFLASGIEGIKVRLTTKMAAGGAEAGTEDVAERARAALDGEEARVRELLGDAVFGVDDESMEVAVSRLVVAAGLTLGLAESLTGGMVGMRLTAVPGASGWFRGSVVAYATEVKRLLLGVVPGPAVSEQAARAMARGAAEVLGADVGLAVTGVAGPTEQDGQPVGTVWVGLAQGGESEAVRLRLPGEREVVRQLATISALDLLRRRLLARQT